jgi:hypothetical protein
VVAAIANEDTFLGAKIEFTIVVGTEKGPAGTTKRFEEIIIGLSFVT